MRSFFNFIVPILCLIPILYECASPISVSGGPKDTIPPSLLESVPSLQATNFQDKTIRLTFDEFVTADQLKQNLIITPSTDNKYTVQVKKNTVLLRFDELFEDSTTYTFNFFKGITDITEKSPAENLVLPFSTGPIIDSLVISGNVRDLLTQATEEGITIGLYTLHDSLDYTKEKPRYFINSDEQGNFKITNIKSDYYRLFSFSDENSNLLFDPAKEKHAFISDTIHLQTNKENIQLNTILLDITEPNLISARPGGKYFEARYNKAIISYHVQSSDSIYQVYSRLNPDKSSVRFYPQREYPDSLQVYINASDTLEQITQDTLHIKFNNSSKKPEKLNVITSPKPKSKFSDTVRFKFKFNKPISQFNIDKLQIAGDSLLSIPISIYSPTITWNQNRTELALTYYFNWKVYSDSLTTLINATLPDTITPIKEINSFELHAQQGSFISVERDSSELVKNQYLLLDDIETGVINYSITTSHKNFIVELIDKKYNTISTKKDLSVGTFTQIPPGQYSLRVLIDSNADGEWTYGNYNLNLVPEPVYLYPGFTELRAKWDITFDNFEIDNLLITE